MCHSIYTLVKFIFRNIIVLLCFGLNSWALALFFSISCFFTRLQLAAFSLPFQCYFCVCSKVNFCGWKMLYGDAFFCSLRMKFLFWTHLIPFESECLGKYMSAPSVSSVVGMMEPWRFAWKRPRNRNLNLDRYWNLLNEQLWKCRLSRSRKRKLQLNSSQSWKLVS